jgi:hypothetical protein
MPRKYFLYACKKNNETIIQQRFTIKQKCIFPAIKANGQLGIGIRETWHETKLTDDLAENQDIFILSQKARTFLFLKVNFSRKYQDGL